jgi:hypothetical protein
LRHRPKVLTPLTPLLAAFGCLMAASPALAQQARPGEVMGMRYLSWSGKAAAPTDGLRRPVAPTPAPIPVSADSSRSSAVQTAAALSARPSRYGAGSPGLTPASAWTGRERTPAPVLAPPPAAQQPDPAVQAQAQADYQAQIQSQYQAWYQSEAQAQYEAQVRAMPQPAQQVVRVPAPETQAGSSPSAPPQYQQQADAGPPAGYDPMAPRRDAPIFRMQQTRQTAPTPSGQAPEQQPQAAPTEIQSPVLTQPVAGRTPSGQAYAGAEPPRESARYYSVHRTEGRQPDPISMPESVYLDNAPIDLAEPPAAPVPTRTINGRTQLIVPNQDPSLP